MAKLEELELKTKLEDLRLLKLRVTELEKWMKEVKHTLYKPAELNKNETM